MATRIVLITGANSGVGYAATEVIASAAPSYHIIMASRSIDKVNEALAKIKASGVKGTLSALQLDVTDDDSVRKAAEHVKGQYGRLDVLINNAAVGSIDSDVRKRFEACLNTNVIGPALVSAAFRPLLLESDNPYSIFVSSGVGSLERASGGVSYLANEDAYRASKAALNMVAIKEYQDYGPKLKVFSYCPGFVVSNLRGTSEELRSGWGRAGDPKVSGEGLLDIIEGKRDQEVGKFVNNDKGINGIYPW